MKKILEKIRSYRVEDLKIVFRDRFYEIENILTKIPEGYINIIFGPHGCGKTELAKALVYASKDLEDVHVIYVGYREEETILRSQIVIPDKEGLEFIKNELRDFVESTFEYLGVFRLIVKGVVTIYEFFKYFRRKLNRQYVIFIDEFRRRDTSISSIRQELEVSANIVKDENAFLKEKVNSCLKVIFMSSDATAQELQLKLSSKCRWWIMWYLPKKEFFDILEDLKCEIDYELIWCITGGNIREIIEIMQQDWKIENYIEGRIENVRQVLNSFIRTYNEDILQILKKISELDVDSLDLHKIWNYLLENNIVMHVDARFWKLSSLPKEPWIGNRNAFQLPIYYWILKEMIEKQTIKISANDIVKVCTK